MHKDISVNIQATARRANNQARGPCPNLTKKRRPFIQRTPF
jgi:ribosomal protein S10